MPLNTNLTASKSKLLELLRTLNSKEWKSLGDFLQSPIYNKRKKVIALYMAFDRYFPFKKDVYKSDFIHIVDDKYECQADSQIADAHNRALDKLFSIFTGLIYEYLILLESRLYPSYNQRLLVSALMKRKRYKEIPKLIEKQAKKQEATKDLDCRKLLNDYLLHEPLLYWDIINQKRPDDVRWQLVASKFTDFSLSNFLRLYCSSFAREKVIRGEYKHPVPKEILLGLIEKNSTDFSPLTQIYFQTLKMLDDEDENSFRSLKGLVEIHSLTLKTDVLRDTYDQLLNFSTRQIRKGNLQYRSEKTQIYLRGIPAKVWNTGLYLSAHHYILLIKNELAMESPNFRWIGQFIEDFKKELAPRYRSIVPVLARAHYYYTQKEFEKAKAALYSLNIRKAEDFFYVLYYKIIWIKIYFEDEAYAHYPLEKHPLPLALDALRKYLEENKTMTPPIKTAYRNFANIVKRIFNYKVKPANKKNVDYLSKRQQEIQHMPLVSEYEWISCMILGMKLN